MSTPTRRSRSSRLRYRFGDQLTGRQAADLLDAGFEEEVGIALTKAISWLGLEPETMRQYLAAGDITSFAAPDGVIYVTAAGLVDLMTKHGLSPRKKVH